MIGLNAVHKHEQNLSMNTRAINNVLSVVMYVQWINAPSIHIEVFLGIFSNDSKVDKKGSSVILSLVLTGTSVKTMNPIIRSFMNRP